MAISQSDVLFEDNHLIAIHKKAGELSQGDKTGDVSIVDDVKAFLKTKYNKPGNVYLGNLHRLDRPVQGILLFAKTSKAADRMSKAFRENKVRKTYWAIVEGIVKTTSGQIQSFLKKDTKTNIVKSFRQQTGGSKPSETHYNVLKTNNQFSLIELIPITGRSHQLRVHCAQELRHPIFGDVKYGSLNKTKDRSLYLLAKEIRFTHPVSKELICVSANVPKQELWQFFLD